MPALIASRSGPSVGPARFLSCWDCSRCSNEKPGASRADVQPFGQPFSDLPRIGSPRPSSAAWQCPTLAEQRARMIACETNDRITRLATLTVSFCSGRWIERNVSGHCRDVHYRGCAPEFGYAVRLVLEPLRERHLQSASIETCPAGSHHPHPLSTARLISFCDSPRPAAAVDTPQGGGLFADETFLLAGTSEKEHHSTSGASVQSPSGVTETYVRRVTKARCRPLGERAFACF